MEFPFSIKEHILLLIVFSKSRLQSTLPTQKVSGRIPKTTTTMKAINLFWTLDCAHRFQRSEGRECCKLNFKLGGPTTYKEDIVTVTVPFKAAFTVL